jgi:hypothetical protein
LSFERDAEASKALASFAFEALQRMAAKKYPQILPAGPLAS